MMSSMSVHYYFHVFFQTCISHDNVFLNDFLLLYSVKKHNKTFLKHNYDLHPIHKDDYTLNKKEKDVSHDKSGRDDPETVYLMKKTKKVIVLKQRIIFKLKLLR